LAERYPKALGNAQTRQLSTPNLSSPPFRPGDESRGEQGHPAGHGTAKPPLLTRDTPELSACDYAHLVRDEGVAGSNPATPTNLFNGITKPEIRSPTD